jgi:AraC-like DNA-binding protein
MGNYNTTLLAILCSCCCYFAFGQEDPSGLENLTFQELFIRVNKGKSFEEIDKIANTIVKKAKKENNFLFLIGGYQTHALIRNNDSVLIYCDSIINLKSKSPNPAFIREAYQIKADYFFNNYMYGKSLDNYLIVAKYAEKENNIEKIIKAKYDIGTLKRRIGENDEALNLYKEGFKHLLEYEKKLDTVLYFAIITEIASVYNDLKQPDSASFYNNLGYNKAVEFKKKRNAKHFALNQGVTLYYKGMYQEAIDSLEKHTPYYENTFTRRNLSLAYYYTGKSYAGIDNDIKSINYFKKVDTVFQERSKIFPIAKDAYNELIQYYKKRKDFKNQLYYVNQLIKVDSILHEEEVYLSKGIYKDYDIPQLKLEKDQILKNMNSKESFFNKVIWIGSIALIIISLGLLYQYRKRHNDKKKFDQIMSSLEMNNVNEEVVLEKDINIKHRKDEEKQLDISEKAVNGILKGLKKFENEQGYLSDKIKLNSLAKEFKTNSNYLSKVVNHYKKQSFANYLNELRVEYFIKQIKADPKMRKFTIKAIATEIGFSNSESFSKAFLKHKGIKPSYFLRELDKIKSEN